MMASWSPPPCAYMNSLSTPTTQPYSCSPFLYSNLCLHLLLFSPLCPCSLPMLHVYTLPSWFSPTSHSFSTLSSCLSYLQLIIAVAGVLSGYNGSFEFKEPGQKYEDTPYVGMRVVGTMFPT